MAEERISHEVLLKRLKRIEGQVRGIQKMIASDRDCESAITQLAAVRYLSDPNHAIDTGFLACYFIGEPNSG